jgi:hypothetical protein
MPIKPLTIRSTKTTPEVQFENGSLTMRGESFPEDAPEFYKRLVAWLQEYSQTDYAKDKTKATNFTSKINFFNTASRGFLLEMVSILNRIYAGGHKVNMLWYYDAEEGIDEDDINFRDLIDDFQVPVEYKPYSG